MENLTFGAIFICRRSLKQNLSIVLLVDVINNRLVSDTLLCGRVSRGVLFLWTTAQKHLCYNILHYDITYQYCIYFCIQIGVF